MPEVLLASSIIDPARLRAYLSREQGAEDDIEQRLVTACNRAVAWMERRTARKLKARNYRTQVTAVTASSTAAAQADIVLSSAAAVVAGDDVLCAGLEAGTTVLSKSGNTVTLSKKVLTTISSGSTVTFGSAPLTIDVEETDRYGTAWPEDGVRVLQCPEKPLVRSNLLAVYQVDAAGTRTAIDLTAARVEEETGRIYLMYGAAGVGVQCVQIECRAGYEEPSATALGHPADWSALGAVQLRVAEVYFTDDTQLRGRATSLSVGSMSVSASDLMMPADIEFALRPYWRRGA